MLRYIVRKGLQVGLKAVSDLLKGYMEKLGLWLIIVMFLYINGPLDFTFITFK